MDPGKRNKAKRPWETGPTESVAQILGALSFGRLSGSSSSSSSSPSSSSNKNINNEDVTSSSTHEEESTTHEVLEEVEQTNAKSTTSDAATNIIPEEQQQQQQRTIEGIISEIDEEDDPDFVDATDEEEDDDDDVNSVEDEGEDFGDTSAAASGQGGKKNLMPKSPVREIVRTYESSLHNTSTAISPVVEELQEMIQDGLIPEGLVYEKVNEVEELSAAQEIAYQQQQQELKRQRLQAEMELGRRRALLAAGKSISKEVSSSSYASSTTLEESQVLSLPHFDAQEGDEDVTSVNSLGDDNPVLSVSHDDVDDDDFVEEIIDDMIEEIIDEEAQDDAAEDDAAKSGDEEKKQPSVDLEELRRQKLQAEMEQGRRRAAEALQKQKGFAEQDDGLTIDTVASTTKTPMMPMTTSPKNSETDLGLLESKSDSDVVQQPIRRSIPDEISEPRFPHIPLSFDQLSESDVLSSALSSTYNEADNNSYQPVSPRKRVAEIIRRDLWDKDETVVESALKLLVDKLMHSTDVITFRNAIARNGGILAIVRAMEQHVEHAGIQIVSCRALEQLALDTENELAIGEVGGVEAILGAMMTHFTHVNVQDAAWSALCNCTCGNACDIMTIDTQGGMSAIVSCMKQHVDHASIQSSAVGTLTNLCWNNESRLADLVTAGGFAVMAMTLQEHWDNVKVRNETAHAMHVLLGGAALAHQEQQGEPDVIDELVLKECETEEELEEDEYTDEEME